MMLEAVPSWENGSAMAATPVHWVGKNFWLPKSAPKPCIYRTSDTQMNYSSHNMDVVIGILLLFGWPAILGDLSRGRTIEFIVDLLCTLRNRLWLLTSEKILLF